MVRITMKQKGQRNNRGPIETLAYFLYGAQSGDFQCLLGAHGRGCDPLQLHLLEFLPASGCNRSRGMSSGMNRRHTWKPAVILAVWPEESKAKITCSNSYITSKRVCKGHKDTNGTPAA
jgi:hypothetical protein